MTWSKGKLVRGYFFLLQTNTVSLKYNGSTMYRRKIGPCASGRSEKFIVLFFVVPVFFPVLWIEFSQEIKAERRKTEKRKKKLVPPADRRRDSSPAACSRSGHRRLGRRCRRPGLRRSRLLPGRHRRGGGLRAHGSPQCLSPRGVRSAMAPPPPHRPYKRPAISDQQRRRDLALQAQSARRADAQARARSLANSLLSPSSAAADTAVEGDSERDHEPTVAEAASKLRGSDARRWFARQIMLPEWMADAPPHLATDWLLPSPPSPNSFSLLLRISIRVPLLC